MIFTNPSGAPELASNECGCPSIAWPIAAMSVAHKCRLRTSLSLREPWPTFVHVSRRAGDRQAGGVQDIEKMLLGRKLVLAGCIPWPDELALTYQAKGYWENISIPHLFERMATEAPDRVAIIQGDLRATLADLWAESGRFAVHFDRLRLAKGQRVVFQLPNATVFFSAFLGLLRIGVIPVMALPAHRETELIHFAQFSDATALFIPAQIREFDFRPMAATVRDAVSSLRHVFVLGSALEGQISLTTLVATPSGKDDGGTDITDLDPGDVALMLLSGGTTALPKLIPRTHNDYVYNFKQSAKIAGGSAGGWVASFRRFTAPLRVCSI